MTRSLFRQQYESLRKLAAGALGEVYLARQTGRDGFERQVVVKRLHRPLGERALELFRRDMRLAAALSHPNIAQILDVGEDDGCPFIVMEHVVGTSLRNLAEGAGRLGKMIPMELSINVIIQILEGLRYAHGFRDEAGQPLGLVHNDVCPHNIIISVDGAVKLLDFGLAQLGRAVLQDGGYTPNKLAYVAPEVVAGEPVDCRADLFSVGVLLYELTVGQRLVRASNLEQMRRVIDEPIPPPTFARAGYPVDLELCVTRALEREPEDRFRSAESMLLQLERFAFDTGLRLSRVRLGQFTAETMHIPQTGAVDGAVEAPAVTAEVSVPEAAVDELDFDKGLFGGGELDSRPDDLSVQQADRTEEATSLAKPAPGAARGATNRSRRAGTVVVTDDLVEEVTELETQEGGHTEDADLLLVPPDDPLGEQGPPLPPPDPEDVETVLELEQVADGEGGEQAEAPDAAAAADEQQTLLRRRPAEEPEDAAEPDADFDLEPAAHDDVTRASEEVAAALADLSKGLKEGDSLDQARAKRLHQLAGGEDQENADGLLGQILAHDKGPAAEEPAAEEPAAEGLDDEGLDAEGLDDEGLDDATIELDTDGGSDIVEIVESSAGGPPGKQGGESGGH